MVDVKLHQHKVTDVPTTPKPCQYFKPTFMFGVHNMLYNTCSDENKVGDAAEKQKKAFQGVCTVIQAPPV